MLRIKSSELFGDGELKTHFYVIRPKGRRRGSLGEFLPATEGAVIGIMYLFWSRDDAQKYMHAFCKRLIQQDPKQWEVVSSDIYGGALRMLDGASDRFSHVGFPKAGTDLLHAPDAMLIDHFVYLLSGREANVPWEEMNVSREQIAAIFPLGEG